MDRIRIETQASPLNRTLCRGSWPHLDERYLEGRRRHILEEHLGTCQFMLSSWSFFWGGGENDGNKHNLILHNNHQNFGPKIRKDSDPMGRAIFVPRFNFLKSLNDKAATVLVVGAGFIGVEWATEIQHFFPRVKLTIIDFLPQPLGPLPANAAKYCEAWLGNERLIQIRKTNLQLIHQNCNSFIRIKMA